MYLLYGHGKWNRSSGLCKYSYSCTGPNVSFPIAAVCVKHVSRSKPRAVDKPQGKTRIVNWIVSWGMCVRVERQVIAAFASMRHHRGNPISLKRSPEAVCSLYAFEILSRLVDKTIQYVHRSSLRFLSCALMMVLQHTVCLGYFYVSVGCALVGK